ncbi:MAG: PQQ-binding-like beta-propeller repeat protein, partial [bacterium]|nr:PQQ-binding-like beta-propeller repeat protein [bacterium]
YDPELDLLYVGTGNASVYNVEIRSPGGGDNLYLSSILALRPETGRLVWHYQTTPGEHWDYTATQQMILTDRVFGGKPRKLLLQAPKNGFFYVLDRETGELLSAEPYVPVSWATHVDLATGRPVVRDEARWTDEDRIVTPHPMGAHSWHPMSFDAGRGLVYMSNFELAYLFMADPDFVYRNGEYNSGEDLARMARLAETLEPTNRMFCTPSRLVAWDVERREKRWEVEYESVTAAGVLSTEGSLVFQGTLGGVFSAYHADTGARLWSIETQVGIMAPPVTYRVDGEQYVAVLAGAGGALGSNFARLQKANEGRLFAFKLGGRAAMPPVRERQPGRVSVEKIDASPDTLERGMRLYGKHCMRCHGPGAASTGLLPDLRHASRQVHATWSDIVLGGTRAKDGMASFADLIDLEQARAIQAYVVARAHHEPSALQKLIAWLPESPFCVRASWIAD